MNNVYIKTTELNSWITKYFPNKDLISIDDLIGCIEDLDSEITKLQEQIEDREQDIQDNFKRIDPASQCNISDSDFH